MSGIKGFIKKYIPIFSIVFFAIFSVCAVLMAIAKRSPAFAEWFVGGIGYAARRSLAWLTDFLPFSLGEVLLMLSPLLITFLIVFAFKLIKKRADGVRFFVALLSCTALLYSSYVCTLGISYKTPTVESYLSLNECEIDRESLTDVMLTLKGEAEKLLSEIEYGEDGASVYGESIEHISAEICDAYGKLLYE